MANETVEQVYDDLAEIGAHDRECPPLARVLTHHRFHGRKRIKEIGDEDWYFGFVDPCVLLFVCDRFLDAHKRELAERDGERKGLLKANESLAADNTRLRGENENLKWKVENFEQVIAAKDKEIADLKAKNTEAFKAMLKRDKEIKRLKACRDGDCERIKLGAEPCKGCHVQVANDEIASLRALVKELADSLDDNPCFDCDSCGEPCECCSDRENVRALVAKAREVCHV